LENALGQERSYNTQFLWLPVGVGIGAVGYFQLDVEPSFNKLLVISLILTLFVYLLRAVPFVALMGGIMLTISLGAFFAKIETMRLDTKFISREMVLSVSARILSWEEQEQGNHRLIVQIIAASENANELVGRKIRLNARSLPEGITIGSGLSGLVRLRPPSGPVRIGSYDFGFHNYYQNLSAQGFFMGQPQGINLPPPPNLTEQFALMITSLRVNMGKKIEATLEGEAGAIAQALILGLRGGISASTNQALRRSGLAHILSISGLHMAMVTGMVLLIGRMILGLFIHFSSRHSPRKITAFIALVFSAFYLLLSGADIAARRAFIMIAVMLLAILCDRGAITMRNLALAAFVILVLAPHEVLSPGFQMSFAATGALIAVFGWWSRRQADKGRPPPHGLMRRFILLPVLSTLIASIVAGSASGLYAAYHFANIAPLGLISNIAALPIMSLLVMPAALIAALLMPFNLEALPLHIMGWGIEWVKSISFWVADLSPDLNPGMVTAPALVWLSMALIVLLFMYSALRWLALVPLVIGLWSYLWTPQPLILIDEEGRMAAILTPSSQLALSRNRPNGFILGQWIPVFNTKIDEIILPDQDREGFSCRDLVCQAKMADGRTFTIALGAGGHENACRHGDIVLLNYISTEDENCGNKALAISRRDLALSGAAMIYADAQQNSYVIKWAQGTSLRPWNAHRYQSKAATGFP